MPPPINWYWQMRDDQLHQVTADTAQVFLGIRLQCARCHHHPTNAGARKIITDWRASSRDWAGRASDNRRRILPPATVTTGEKNPLTGQTPEPKYPDGEYAKFTPEQDPRHALVDWMTQPDNPFFARVLVNRLWGHFMGRGLVDEVDDIRETNPPSNPELLDALARDFIDHKFDVKHIIRTLLSSRVYQLSSEPTEHNRHDRQNFARFYGRRLIAEVLHDARRSSLRHEDEVQQHGGLMPAAVDLPHEGFGSYFLDTFDRPRRVTGCECERSASATLSQVLLMANSDEIENKLANGKGTIATLAQGKEARSRHH